MGTGHQSASKNGISVNKINAWSKNKGLMWFLHWNWTHNLIYQYSNVSGLSWHELTYWLYLIHILLLYTSLALWRIYLLTEKVKFCKQGQVVQTGREIEAWPLWTRWTGATVCLTENLSTSMHLIKFNSLPSDWRQEVRLLCHDECSCKHCMSWEEVVRQVGERGHCVVGISKFYYPLLLITFISKSYYTTK